MAVTTAALSGSIKDLGLEIPDNYLARVVLVVEANTPGSLLRDTSGNTLLAGAKRVTVDKTTGAFSQTLVTTNSADVQPADDRLYKATLIYPSGKPGAKNELVESGWFPFTAAASLADVWQGIEVTAVSTALYESISMSVAAAEASAVAAAAGAQSSAASATLAQTLVTSDLGTTDGQTRALIEDINSQTSGAIAARFGTLWLPASQMILSVGSPVAAQYGGDPYWQLPDVTPSEVSGSVNIPDGWATADLTVVWFQESIGGNVLLRSKTRSYVTAGDVGYAPWADSAGGVGTTAGAYKIVRTHVGTGIAVTPGPRLFSIYRDPTDAADYLAGSIGVLGIQIDRAS